RNLDHSSEVEVFDGRGDRARRIEQLLHQRPHIEINARRSDLPLRQVVLINPATGNLNAGVGCRMAIKWTLMFGFKTPFNDHDVATENHGLDNVAISGEAGDERPNELLAKG